MKIVYITAELPGGAREAFVIPEITALIRSGHEVLVVPRSWNGTVVHEDAKQLLEYSACQRLLSIPVLATCAGGFLRRPGRALMVLRRLLQASSPRKVAANLAVFPKGLWLAHIASRWRASHLHAHWAGTTATMAMVASEVSGIPWSFTAHRWDIVENNLFQGKAESATLVRFISQSGLQMARSLGTRSHEGNAQVVHMGVDLPAVLPEHSSGGEKIVLCPASLLPVKGHAYLIEALALLNTRGVRLSLWLAGSGELRAALEQQVSELGLTDRVRFMGQVSHAELLRLYGTGGITAVVLPSLDLGGGLHEGIPVALIEAMGFGIPVISTRTGGIPELLDGGAGVLVSPKDPSALADALACIVTEPAMASQIGIAGRQRVVEEFAISTVADTLARCFEQREGNFRVESLTAERSV